MTGVVDDAAFLFVARKLATFEPELGVEFTVVVVVVCHHIDGQMAQIAHT